MSYPDLGCFAECLECEICDNGLDLEDIDLFGFEDMFEPGEPWDDPGFWDSDVWDEEEEGNIFDDFPTGISIEDTEVSPSWDNGPSINWSIGF